jgi:ribonuclease P protein subunit RPR2
MTIPEERIDRLESLAGAATEEDRFDLAREYVRLARRIAERHRLSLPQSFRRFTCDDCDVYIRPGHNGSVRLQSGHVVLTCDCGAQQRHGYA